MIKGIILAGGSGSRLYPLTLSISKQLLPVYDKPMIYYPISIVMLAGIKEILLITTPRDLEQYKQLLGDGSQWGVHIQYKVQKKPEGIAQSLILGEDFLNESPSLLVLGDNIFYGDGLGEKLKKITTFKEGACIFNYFVQDPERYGVVEFDQDGRIIDIQEKPLNPKSNFVVTGIYYFDKFAPNYAKNLKFSGRNELEIVDLIKIYLKKNLLFGETLGRGYAWLDTGTHESLLDAQLFIQTIEKRQGLKIGCPEEIAYREGWINKRNLKEIANKVGNNDYGNYLRGIN